MTDPRASIPKPLAMRVSELLQGLLVVRDATRGMEIGKDYQVIALSAQLRALLLERRSDSFPLLLSVLDDLGLDQTLFVMSSEWSEHLPQLVFSMSGPPLTRHRVLPAQTQVALDELADHPVVTFEDVEYTVEDLIRLFANKTGGAHYARSLPEHFARMLELGRPEMLDVRRALLNLLAQVGQAVVEAGVELLDRTAALEAFVDIGIVSKSRGVFLQFAHPELPMALSVGLTDDQRLAVEVVGIDGSRVGLRIDAQLDWAASHQLRIRLAHDSEMGAELQVLLDGTINRSASVDRPVFVPVANLEEFDLRVNGGGSSSWEGAVALGSVMVRSHGEAVDDARALLAMVESAKSPDRKVVLYEVGSTGHSPSGQRDISNSEGVTLSRMSTAVGSPSAP